MKIVITENRLDNFLKKRGLKNTIIHLGGVSNFIKTFNIETPNDLLRLFTDLEIVQSEERSNYTLFRLKEGDNYFIYDRNHKYVFVNYYIWMILEDYESYSRVQYITQKWIENVYGLSDIETIGMDAKYEKML